MIRASGTIRILNKIHGTYVALIALPVACTLQTAAFSDEVIRTHITVGSGEVTGAQAAVAFNGELRRTFVAGVALPMIRTFIAIALHGEIGGAHGAVIIGPVTAGARTAIIVRIISLLAFSAGIAFPIVGAFGAIAFDGEVWRTDVAVVACPLILTGLAVGSHIESFGTDVTTGAGPSVQAGSAIAFDVEMVDAALTAGLYVIIGQTNRAIRRGIHSGWTDIAIASSP